MFWYHLFWFSKIQKSALNSLINETLNINKYIRLTPPKLRDTVMLAYTHLIAIIKYIVAGYIETAWSHFHVLRLKLFHVYVDWSQMALSWHLRQICLAETWYSPTASVFHHFLRVFFAMSVPKRSFIYCVTAAASDKRCKKCLKRMASMNHK